MVEITLNGNTLRYISLFERVTGTRVKDCIETEEKLVFIVNNGHISKAIGRRGDNITKLKEMLNKSVQVVEYSDDPERFIKNIFRSYKPSKVEIESRGNVIHATVTVDSQVKGKAIGREGKNLKLARDILSRHHPIQSLSVA